MKKLFLLLIILFLTSQSLLSQSNCVGYSKNVVYAEIKAKNLPYETIMTNEEEYITAFNYRDQMAYRWFFQDGICIKTYWMFDCSLTKAVNHTLSQDMPVHNEQGAFYNPDSGLLFINTGFTDEQTGYCILAITKTTQKYD